MIRLRRPIVAVATITAFIALVVTSVALAWSETYAQNTAFWAGRDEESAFNSNLVGNALSFDNIYGGVPNMGSRYINSLGGGINEFIWDNEAFVDERDVAYGAAQCRANTANQYNVYVYQCYTSN
jgi:hypothetical protein